MCINYLLLCVEYWSCSYLKTVTVIIWLLCIYHDRVLSWKLYEYAAIIRWSFKSREIFYMNKKRKRFHLIIFREKLFSRADMSLIINKRVLELTDRRYQEDRTSTRLHPIIINTDSMRSILCDAIAFDLFIILKRAREVPESQSVTVARYFSLFNESRIIAIKINNRPVGNDPERSERFRRSCIASSFLARHFETREPVRARLSHLSS